MGVTLTFFFIYHLLMLRIDTTTNERLKRSDYREFFKDELAKLEAYVKTETAQDKIITAENKIKRF